MAAALLPPPFIDTEAIEEDVVNDGAAGATEELASATPKSGSVTQSSNKDGSDITTDTTRVNYLVNPASASSGQVEVVVSGDVDMRLNAAVDGIYTYVGTNSFRSYAGHYSVFRRSNGLLFEGVAVWSVYDLPGGTDWVAIGNWGSSEDHDSIDPDNWDLGVFADSSNPYDSRNINSLTGEFQYSGQSEGYLITEDTNGEFVFEDTSGRVELTADFDANPQPGTISGEIDLRNDVTDRFVVVLEETSIGTADSGFFTGNIKVKTSGSPTGEGKWGGQFFGDDAEGVIGTYGGLFDENGIINEIELGSDLEKVWFAGSFFALEE